MQRTCFSPLLRRPSPIASPPANVKQILAETDLSLGVVILAAGRSTRMGRPKLLLPWGPTSVLGHLVQQWQTLGARQTAVVSDPADVAIRAEMDRLAFSSGNRIDNPDPERGMFSSIQCAANWAGWRQELSHWVIVLGDQPHLSYETLKRLLAFCAAWPEMVCQPARHRRGRHPVILPRHAFSALARSNTTTLKDFLQSMPSQIAYCQIDDPDLDIDLDRPEDYFQALDRTQNKS
jgi:molybdenum cofactor cytidylyltransferase